MWIIRPNVIKSKSKNLLNYLFNILIWYFCLFNIVATANPHVSIHLLHYWNKHKSTALHKQVAQFDSHCSSR